MIHNELSFLFSQFDWLSDRPDSHQIVGLETEHFFNVSARVGHAVFCLNLTDDVLDGSVVTAGNGLNRIAPAVLGEALQVEDLPLQNPSDVGPGQRGFFRKSGVSVFDCILNHILERLI